jgi:hypothetical protein
MGRQWSRLAWAKSKTYLQTNQEQKGSEVWLKQKCFPNKHEVLCSNPTSTKELI